MSGENLPLCLTFEILTFTAWMVPPTLLVILDQLQYVLIPTSNTKLFSLVNLQGVNPSPKLHQSMK